MISQFSEIPSMPYAERLNVIHRLRLLRNTTGELSAHTGIQLRNNTFSKKPKIRPDGSVDYWSINMVEPVEKGQVIAIYKPPVPGEDGMTVKGRPLPAKRARELPPLKGRGFTRQEDGNTYTSNMDGKIDMAVSYTHLTLPTNSRV